MYKRIKELREDNDLLQKQIAIPLNITRQQYGLYESGERKADQNILYSLAEYFKVPIDDFFPQRDSEKFDELELLFDKNKDILTDEDKEYMKFIIEKRKREIDKQLDGE